MSATARQFTMSPQMCASVGLQEFVLQLPLWGSYNFYDRTVRTRQHPARRTNFHWLKIRVVVWLHNITPFISLCHFSWIFFTRTLKYHSPNVFVEFRVVGSWALIQDNYGNNYGSIQKLLYHQTRRSWDECSFRLIHESLLIYSPNWHYWH